jgi:hypothetical protein
MSKVVQFNEARREKQEHLKREYERVLFNRILGCYTVIEKVGLRGVEMRDISKSGCSFRMAAEHGAFNQGEEIDFRFYFSNNTYLPAKLVVKRVLKVEEGGHWFWEHGCSFDQGVSTFSAVEKFVDFVNAYATNAKEDKGELAVWF